MPFFIELLDGNTKFQQHKHFHVMAYFLGQKDVMR